MAKKDELPQDLVDRLAREENKADRELITKPVKAIAEGAKKMYNAATGKGTEDFEPRKLKGEVGGLKGSEGKSEGTKYTADRAATSPVGGEGSELRSVNMGKKSKATRPEEFKKGGKVSSASKRADGIATKGKTRGRIV